MAQGDVLWFDQALVDEGLKLHNLETDVIKVGVTVGTTTPAVTTPDPRWGAGGTTNFAAEEVTPGGTYAAGGAAIANNTYTLSGGLAVFDGDNISWTQNVANPTNAVWGIIYNDTDAGKRALGAVDLGGLFDMRTGPLNITWNVLGIMRKNQA